VAAGEAAEPYGRPRLVQAIARAGTPRPPTQRLAPQRGRARAWRACTGMEMLLRWVGGSACARLPNQVTRISNSERCFE
jgi:hypothetical protein